MFIYTYILIFKSISAICVTLAILKLKCLLAKSIKSIGKEHFAKIKQATESKDPVLLYLLVCFLN